MKRILEALVLWGIMLILLATAWTIGTAKVDAFIATHGEDVQLLTGN